MRRFVLLFFPLLAAVLAMTGAASAASGVDRAKAAGIFVDPAVEPLMEEAPAGSCLSDPTLPDCPKTTAVVYAPDLFHVAQDERPFMPPSPTSAKAEQLRTEAAAAVIFNCYVKVNLTSPYLAAGYEQADGQHFCLDTISDLDLYFVLYKYYNYKWNNMAYRWFYPTNVNAYWNGSIRYRCKSTSVSRNWLAKLSSWVVYKGTVYAAVSQRKHTDKCG